MDYRLCFSNTGAVAFPSLDKMQETIYNSPWQISADSPSPPESKPYVVQSTSSGVPLCSDTLPLALGIRDIGLQLLRIHTHSLSMLKPAKAYIGLHCKLHDDSPRTSRIHNDSRDLERFVAFLRTVGIISNAGHPTRSCFIRLNPWRRDTITPSDLNRKEF